MKKLVVFFMSVIVSTLSVASDLTKVNLKGENQILKLKNLRLPEARTVLIRENIEQYITDEASTRLKEMASQSKDDIFMLINTNGGDVQAGYELITTMKYIQQVQKININCVIETKAYSMGAIIQQYCHKTYIQKFAMILHHQAAYQLSGSAEQVENRQAAMAKQLDVFMTDLSAQMGITLKQFKDKIRSEWWATAEEAAKFGLVDGIVENLIYGPFTSPDNSGRSPF